MVQVIIFISIDFSFGIGVRLNSFTRRTPTKFLATIKIDKNIKIIILFDQDTLPYRQSIYRFFAKNFKSYGYRLIVVYDKKLNSIDSDKDLFIGSDYRLIPLLRIIKI